MLRLAAIDSRPGGLFQDEAAEGLDAWRLLHVPGFHPLFFADDGGREVLFGYVVAAVFRVAGDSVATLRATAALVGIAGVALTPLLLRRFGRVAVVAGTAWAAGSLWLVCVSRDGFRCIAVVLVGTLALWALAAWSDRPASRARALAAGAVCGLGLWTYQPLKLLPLLVVVWLVWLRRADRPAYDALRTQLGAAVAAYAVVAAPIAVAAIMDPTSYFGRGLSVSAANPDQGGLSGLPLHALRTLGMFGVTGDPNARHDVDAAALLPPWIAVLAAIGAWRAWRLRRGDPVMRLVLAGVPVFLLPGIAATEGGAPHGLRLLGVAPACAVLVGLGAAEIVDRLRGLGAVATAAGGVALAVALGGTGALAASAYFTRPAADVYASYSGALVALGDAARTHPGSVVVATGYDALTVDFVARGVPTRVVDPGTPVGGLAAGTPVYAGSRSDLAAAAGSAAAARATPAARDASGAPVVWMTTAP